MDSKNEKLCHLLSFIMMLVYFRIVSTTNIDCEGKPFHCVNSTHFMICVDVGAGISKTVDDFMIQCPSKTVCHGTNYFECEYQVPTTTESIIRQVGENIKFETIPHTTTRLSEYVNTISVTARSDIITDTNIQPASATIDLILTTTEPYETGNVITASSKRNPAETREPLESFKLSKDKIFLEASILPFSSKSEKSIEANTTNNITNESNILNNLENAAEALNKTETLLISVDTLLHSETTEESSTNQVSTMNFRDDPYSYNSNIVRIKTVPDLIHLTTTDYLNKEKFLYKYTTPDILQDASNIGTTKLLPQDFTTTSTILSENVNLPLSKMENETLTTVLNFTEQTTEISISFENATESNILSTQNDIIRNDTASIPSWNTSFAITNENITVTPGTTVPSLSTVKPRIKSIENITMAEDNKENTTVSYSTIKDNNFNLIQENVKISTPLEDILTTPNSITRMQASKNTTKSSSEAPTTMKGTRTHLLQDQTGTEISLTEDLKQLNIVKEIALLFDNNLSQTPASTTFSSPINYDTTNDLITKSTREPIRSIKVPALNSDVNSYVSTNTENTIVNKDTKGFLPIASETTTARSTTVSTDTSNTMLYLDDQQQGKTLSSTINPLVTKINTSVSEAYIDNENQPVEHIVSVKIKKKIPEKPHVSRNAENNYTFSRGDQTTLEMSLPTDIYEVLTDENNVIKINTREPTQPTQIIKTEQLSVNNTIKEVTTNTTLTFNTRISETTLLSRDQIAKDISESTSSPTPMTHIINKNITTDNFVSENIESTTSIVSSKVIQKNKIHMDNINTSTNTIKKEELLSIQDLYALSTEMPSLPDGKNVNVTNIPTIVSDSLTTSSSIHEKETFLSQNFTSVKIDNNSENFTTEKIITEPNINITGNNLMPSLDNMVQDQYRTTKNMLLPQQLQNINIEIEMLNKFDVNMLIDTTEKLGDKDTIGSIVYPRTERLEIQPKVTDMYDINNNKSDIIEIATIPESNLDIETLSTVQMSDNILTKINKANKIATKVVTTKNEEIKDKNLPDDKQTTQILLETTVTTLNISNFNDKNSNQTQISNRTVNVQAESLKPITVDQKVSASNINIPLVPAPENTETISENNNNINKENMVNDNTVSIKVTEDIVALDSVFPSLTPAEIDSLTTMNPRNTIESTVNILQLTYHSMTTQKVAQETKANPVLGSSLHASTAETKDTRDKITTIDPQIVFANTETIFKNNNSFQNKVVISDTVSTQTATEIMDHSVMSMSMSASTDNFKVLSNNEMTTRNPQIVAGSTEKIFENNNNIENKINLTIIDTTNTQKAKESIAHPVVSSLITTSEDKGSAINKVTVINPQIVTEILGDAVQYNTRSFENNEDKIASDMVNIQLAKETAGHSFLAPLIQKSSRNNSKVSTSIKFPTIHPRTGSTQPIFDNKNNINIIENKENLVISDIVNPQLINKTTAHSSLSLSTPVSTDKVDVSANNKITTIHPQTVGKYAEIISGNINNNEYKKDVVVSVTGSIHPYQEATAPSVSSSLDTKDNFEISTNKGMTTINPFIVAGGTEEIDINNNSFNTMLTHTVSTQSAQESMAYSNLGSTLSNIITTTHPQLVIRSKGSTPINNNNNNFGSNIDTSDTVNTVLVNPTVHLSTPSLTDEINNPSSNIIAIINPDISTESTSKMMPTNNNSKNKVDTMARNTVLIKSATETTPHSDLSISRDAFNVSAAKIIKNLNPDIVTESTQKTITINNNSTTRSKADSSDISHIQLDTEAIGHFILNSSTLASTNDKVSTRNRLSTLNLQNVAGNYENIIENKNINNNLKNKVNVVISDKVNTQEKEKEKENIDQSIWGYITPTLLNEIKDPSTTNKNPERKIKNNNKFENKMNVTYSDYIQSTEGTTVYSMFGSSAAASSDAFKVSIDDKFSSKYPLIAPESTGKIIENSSSNADIVLTENPQIAIKSMAHSVWDTSTAVSMDTRSFQGTVAPILSTSTSASSVETNLENYTLPAIDSQFATRSMEKVSENDNRFTNEQKADTVVHTLLENYPSPISFKGVKNNASSVPSIEPLSFSTKNQTLQLNVDKKDMKISAALMSNNTSKKDLNKISYTNPMTLTILFPALQEKDKLNNPWSLNTSETLSKNDSVINNEKTRNVSNVPQKEDNSFILPSQSIHNTNKTHEHSSKQTNLQQYEAGKQFQNKSNNITSDAKASMSTANKVLFTCKNRFRGRYADENDCRKFYICIGRNQPILGECPVNTVFSEIKKQCTKNLSHCIRHNQFRCIQSGKFGDALKNNVYYICVKNKNSYVRFQFKCQDGYYFNKNSVKCVSDEQTASTYVDIDSDKSSGQNTIENKSREKKLTKNAEKNMCTKEGKFPDPRESRKYYICVKNKNTYIKLQFQCQNGYHLNNNSVKCVRDQQTSSRYVDNVSNKASGESMVEKKSKENNERKHRNKHAEKNMCTKEGKFPDPHDCRKYFICSKKSKTVFRRKSKKCDSDEVFHPDKEKCVDNDSYECD